MLAYPVIGDGFALEDRCEEDAEPPTKDVGAEHPYGGFEPSSRIEDTTVESEDRGFDQRHGASVEDLKGEHDLTLGQQLIRVREAGRFGVSAVQFIRADTCDGGANDVVDGDSKSYNLERRCQHKQGQEKRECWCHQSSYDEIIIKEYLGLGFGLDDEAEDHADDGKGRKHCTDGDDCSSAAVHGLTVLHFLVSH